MPASASPPENVQGNLIREAVVYALAKGLPGGLGLISVIVFVRLIGAEEFGLYAIMFASVGMWSSFASGWFYQSLLRHYSGWRATPTVLYRHLVTGIGLSVILFGVAFATSLQWVDATLSGWDYLWGLLLGGLIITQTVALSCWQSELQPRVVFRVETIRAIVTFGLSCLLAWRSPHAVTLIAGATLGYAASLGGGSRLRFPGADQAGDSPPSLRQSVGYGWPLSLWFLAQLSFAWLDRVMIEGRFGLVETGLFAGLSEILTRGFSLLIYPLTLAAYPRVAALYNRSEPAAARRVLRFTLGIGLVISLVVVTASHFSRNLWVGWLLPDAEPLVRLQPLLIGALTLSGALWQLALLAHKPLELQSRTIAMLVTMVIALIIKVAGNTYGLDRWGVSGAAYASVVSGLFYALACTALARRSGPPS